MSTKAKTKKNAATKPARHKDLANAIRFLSADAVQAANSGHPGMPMGMADVATVLFKDFMKFDPKRPDWADRDRFVLSAGHGSMLLYSLLHLTGYPGMTMSQLKNFRQLGSRTAGHPEHDHAPGVETTTGPLGQGIAAAVGMALAEKMMAARYGNSVVDHRTYVVCGDGCLMEGISHEAISMAGHWGLKKLVVFWDDNEICIDGETNLAVSDDQLKRFEASGWNVVAIDGHAPKAIKSAIAAARKSEKPTLIGCKTTIGFGAPTLAGSHKTHGAPLGGEELAGMREALNWDCKPFTLPDNVVRAWKDIGAKGAKTRMAWEKRLAKLGGKKRASFKEAIAGKLDGTWEKALNAHKADLAKSQPRLATRRSSGKALEVLTANIENLIGGSADLTGSVNTKTSRTDPITPKDFSGRYIHYGVREHGMAAVMNGMALHGGFVPYGGTFLVFAGYMSGAMRLSALMGVRVVYVLTHDSIGLGEDGPTHQPVETLAGLRAMPNFNLYRPADAVETVECWAMALKTPGTPSGMVLTRQGVPTLRTKHTNENLCSLGAYVLAEAQGGYGKRRTTLLATGSEVSVAMAAKGKLEEKDVPTAVVSMPCWELFEAQDVHYREKILKPGSVRVGVEAAMGFGWDRYIGENGGFVGMATFGASAPGDRLFKHFGITADSVVAEVAKRL